MPVDRYLRNVRVTVGDEAERVQIEQLYIRFRIRLEATGTPAEGAIDIYNLNESNETRIRERGRRVMVETSYGEADLETLFEGIVRRVERQRVGLDRVTRVHVGGDRVVEEDDAPPRVIFMRSYEGTVPVRTIVADGIEAMGLESGPLDAIPEEATETDFTYNGDVRIMLTHRLLPLGLHWYIESGVVRLSRYRQTADDRPEGVTISEASGMIGTPAVTDDGIRVRTLLDPRISLDTRIKVQSSVLGEAASGDAVNERAAELESGSWKVIELTHTGDNRGGSFDTVIEGRPLD